MDNGHPFVTGIILSGSTPPSESLRRFIQNSDVPILHAPQATSTVISMLEKCACGPPRRHGSLAAPQHLPTDLAQTLRS